MRAIRSNAWLRGVVTAASLVQIGFGLWHFFVPWAWNWYAAMDPAAPELVLAVRAINFFFSLCLVLLGAQTLLLVWREPAGAYALRLALGAAAILWSARVGLQLVYPQGSISPALQYGMLASFVAVAAAYVGAFVAARGPQRADGSMTGLKKTT